MSISQIESKIKSLQSEIARLNKAYTDEAKKECGYLTSASRTQKSITKNTSPSMLKTKLKSISSDSEKAEKSRKKRTEKKTGTGAAKRGRGRPRKAPGGIDLLRALGS